MTDYELLNYKMNDIEMNEWLKLGKDIKTTFLAVEVPDIPVEEKEEILNKRTMNHEPFYGSRGYIRDKGYYSVQEGDRGNFHLDFSNASYLEAKNKMLKVCAHDITYSYVTNHMSELQEKHKGLWHYCEIIEGIDREKSRIISHIEEENNWIYDEKYDYRKYWFELLLYFDKRILTDSEYRREVTVYEEFMNHSMTNKKWIYNTTQEQFNLTFDL